VHGDYQVVNQKWKWDGIAGERLGILRLENGFMFDQANFLLFKYGQLLIIKKARVN
jgi:hypothetical protein